MKYVKIDPPGTWCFNRSFFEMLKETSGRRFLEVGCGDGGISAKLLAKGYTGTGIDFSEEAIARSSLYNRKYVGEGKYKLITGNIMDKPSIDNNFDFILGFTIMEHIKNDVEFLKILKSYLRPGGYIFVSVPGRKDKWSLEDETTGHYRRYERDDIFKIFNETGYIDPLVWSIGVPLANLLFPLSKLSVKLSNESKKSDLSMEEQSKKSGIREIPFKTVFPSFFRLIINRFTVFPFYFGQRPFYNTGLGLSILARGQKPF